MLYRRLDLPFPVYEVDVVSASDEELPRISRELGLGLNLEEMRAIKRYYCGIGRNPTDVEIQCIAQTWSEHCRHKTFKGLVVDREGRVLCDNMFKTYIARVVEELKPDWCVSVFEDNAGIVEFDDGYGVAVKVETHNHPSAVEPFGGAATGVGGVIRDVLGVWADPIACTDVLCFGPLDYPYEKLPPGVKHPKYLFRGVVAGIAHYGNNMGIPTVAGAIYFDEGYVGNVVVYCGCIGVLPLDKYYRRAKAGDVLVLAGGRTGRDGIHGVTFASAELSEDAEKYRSAVQIPNPFEEEKLRRAIIRIRDEGLGSAITDLGGGGLSCAVCETAHHYGLGAVVELSRVPLKDPGMAPWEIWLSESQERMLLVVPRENLDRVLEIFAEEEVEATPIGELVPGNHVKVYYQGHLVGDLDLDFLFSPPRAVRVADYREPHQVEPDYPEPSDYGEVLVKLLASPNICSREPVIRMYDHEVKGLTAIKPLHGMRAGPSDAVVLKPLPRSWKGLVVSIGFKPGYSKLSPYWMAASSIDEAIRNAAAVGGSRWALLDNFTWGNPEKPDRMGMLLEAVKACYDFAKLFQAPFISGKDSLYNESPLGPVNPTLLITCVAIIPDLRRAVTLDLKEPGNPIYIVGLTRRELGGSEYHRLLGVKQGKVPRVYPEAKKIVDRIVEAIDQGLAKACHDVSSGGLGVAVAEMCFTAGLGAEVDLSKVPASEDAARRDDYLLFSESNTRFLVEVKRSREEEFMELMRDVPVARIGVVSREPRLVIRGVKGKVIVDQHVDELWKAWRSGLKL